MTKPIKTVAVQNDCRTDEQNVYPKVKRNLNMDEALSETDYGLFNYLVIFLTSLTLFAAFAEGSSIPYVLPVSECDLNLTAGEKGILSGVQFIGMICSCHLWGFLADTKGRKRVILPTLLTAFLISVASSFVQNFYIFVTLRFFNGFFISGCSATIFAYISEFHDKTHRDRSIVLSSTIFGLLIILEPLLAWSVINQNWQFNIPLINLTYKPWRLFLIANAIPELVAFIILLFLPESPKFVLLQKKQEDVYQILEKMNRINNGKDKKLGAFVILGEEQSIENGGGGHEEGCCGIMSSVWNQTAALFKPPHLLPTILICFLQFCAYFVFGCANFEPLILNRMDYNLDDYVDQRAMMCDVIDMKPMSLNDTNIALEDKVCRTKLEQGMLIEMFMAESGFFSCCLLINVLINKVGKYWILLAIFLITGLSGISCVLHDIPLLQIGGYILFTYAPGSAGNIISAATVEVYPTNLRGMAICISVMSARFGSVVGANFVGLLIEKQCEMIFYLPGALLLVAGSLTHFIPKVHDKNTHEQAKIPRASVYSLHL